MDQKRIDEIRARCEAATPGPWQQDEYANMVWAINPYGKGMMHLADIRGWGHLTGAGACAFDDAKGFAIQAAIAAFIAHARDDIPYLLSEVDRLQAELEQEKRRSEAAIEDLTVLSNKYQFCDTCKYNKGNGIRDCRKYDCVKVNLYEWRGVVKE